MFPPTHTSTGDGVPTSMREHLDFHHTKEDQQCVCQEESVHRGRKNVRLFAHDGVSTPVTILLFFENIQEKERSVLVTAFTAHHAPRMVDMSTAVCGTFQAHCRCCGKAEDNSSTQHWILADLLMVGKLLGRYTSHPS